MSARRLLSAAIAASALAVTVPTFIAPALAAQAKKPAAAAQKPADAPKDATGHCGDGSYTTAATKQGACSSHGRVKTWWGAANATSGDVPKGATAQCKDGTFSFAKLHRGAGRHQGGLAD